MKSRSGIIGSPERDHWTSARSNPGLNRTFLDFVCLRNWGRYGLLAYPDRINWKSMSGF